jgi:hypothetical protein
MLFTTGMESNLSIPLLKPPRQGHELYQEAQNDRLQHCYNKAGAGSAYDLLLTAIAMLWGLISTRSTIELFCGVAQMPYTIDMLSSIFSPWVRPDSC